MQTKFQKSTICPNHKKTLQILVVNQALYICQDCAIFEGKYKNQKLLEKQFVPLKLKQITQLCLELNQLEKENQKVMSDNLCQLLNSVDTIQTSLIDDIKRQFYQIKATVQNQYLTNLQVNDKMKEIQGKSVLLELQKETSPQYKVKRQNQSGQNLAAYQSYLNRQSQKINHTFKEMKQNIENNVVLKINVQSAFDNVINSKIGIRNERKDEDLLDFSEYSIQFQPEQSLYSSVTFAQNIPHEQVQMAFFKRQKVERMKTAPCLEDSACSIEQIPKQKENYGFNIQMSQSTCLNESILSDRSISCSSVISKTPTCSTIMKKQVSKKLTIEVTTINEFQTKLMSISPTIKVIKICNIPISSQQFSSLLKQKISKSFIHTLEINGCPKLSEKILMDLKLYRCKTLKKIQIRECKEINWVDKKVKDLVRKLEADAVRILF